MTKNKITLLIVILCIPASYSLLIRGFYEPHDLHHFADIYEMWRSLGSGQVPPRWGPDFLYGFGYPLFNFYYPMPFYIGALFFAILGSVQLSFKLVFVLGILLSISGMYLFLREFFSKYASLTGAVLFLYTPYRAVEIYVRGAMGEFLGLSLLPFAYLTVVKAVRNPKRPRFLAFAALINALFILTHNYLWALSYPFLFLLLFTISKKKNIFKSLKKTVVIILFSLGLASYWWIPAIFEQRLVSSTTPFPLIDHFPFIKQLLIPSWGYGSSVWGPGDDISFQIGLVNLAVVMFVVLSTLFKRKLLKKKYWYFAYWSLFGFFISSIFMNVRTYPIWNIMPFHDFIQFPWRLLIFTTFFSSVCASFCIDILKEKKRIYLTIVIISLSVILTFSYFKPSQIFYKSDSEYLSRFFANRMLYDYKSEVSPSYLQYSEDYLLLPKWLSSKPTQLAEKKIEGEGEGETDIRELTAVDWVANINLQNPTKIFFNSLYFPGWKAKLDGKEASLLINLSTGNMLINAPSGTHTVEFYWAETGLRKLADAISLLSIIVIILLYFKKGDLKYV